MSGGRDPRQEPHAGDVVESALTGQLRIILVASGSGIQFMEIPSKKTFYGTTRSWKQWARRGKVITGNELATYQTLFQLPTQITIRPLGAPSRGKS
jgi:hypothetical protein